MSFIFIPYFREIVRGEESNFNRFCSRNIKIISFLRFAFLIFFDSIKSFEMFGVIDLLSIEIKIL